MMLWNWLSDWGALHWLILGVILLILEISGTAGLLLWSGLSALLTGVIVWFIAPSLFGQWVLFAILSALTTYGWFKFNRRQDQTSDPAPVLNQRMQRCLGAETVLIEDVAQGKSRVRLDDTYWPVITHDVMKAGTPVVVVATEGTYLIVKPLDTTTEKGS